MTQLYNLEGYRYFFIDEVHQYKNWQQELKNLYDAFPDVSIIYSGNSMLELTQGSHDLSRRAVIYYLQGMSFREYYNLANGKNIKTIALNDLFSEPTKYQRLGKLDKVLGHFKKYLKVGYYPFFLKDEHTYYERLARVIDKIIFEDIATCFDLKTQNLSLFKKILGYLASIPPAEINTNNIANNLQTSHQTVFNYLTMLENVGLVKLLYPREGGDQYLRKPQKIFLRNTNLLYTLKQFVGGELNMGSLREIYFTQTMSDSSNDIFYSKKGDFCSQDFTFEIGGKNKTAKQLAGVDEQSFVIKDNILTATQRTLPLFFLGFGY